MKRLLVCAALALALAALPATRHLLAQEAAKLPTPEPKAFWAYISQTHPYKQWPTWPGKPRLYQSRSAAHGAMVSTYLNEIALEGVKKGQNPLPEGSIIVKENYDPRKRFTAVTTMYKVPGYDPQHDDWFWGKYSPQGKPEMVGKVKGCIECHGRQAKNDYIMTEALGAPKGR